MEQFVLAVDIGTSSVRAMIFNKEGSIISRSQIKYSIHRPKPGYEEQDPDELKELTFHAIATCLKNSAINTKYVKAISFSSQMYGIFAIDANGNPLCPIILWSDFRAEKQAEAIKDSTPAGPFYERTGCPANSIYPIYKIAWIREEAPQIFQRARKFISIKEYIVHQLTNRWVIDHSLASATGLLDIHSRRWDPQALDYAALRVEQLSVTVSGEDPIPFTNTTLRNAWGLPQDVVVFSGGGDGPLANLGSGAATHGRVNIDLGTSGAVRVTLNHPAIDTEGSLWCYCLTKDSWVYGGILTNVGNAYQWIGSSLAFFDRTETDRDIYEELNKYVESTEPGSKGVFFLPYLNKVRSPYWDNTLPGVLYGLRIEHDIRHITRALLEAIAYDIAILIDRIKNHTPIQEPILLTGGLSKNQILPQILTDILHTSLKVPNNTEGSISGAALMGFHGLNHISEYKFTDTGSDDGTEVVPREEVAAFYKREKQRYTELVKKIREIGSKL